MRIAPSCAAPLTTAEQYQRDQNSRGAIVM
jgi:hypothetical protein